MKNKSILLALIIAVFSNTAAFSAGNQFEDFVGTVQSAEDTLNGSVSGLKWSTLEFSWPILEPFEGRINFEALEKLKKVVAHNANIGISTVPVLTGTPRWAARRGGYSYFDSENIYQIGPVKNIKNGMFERDVIVNDLDGIPSNKETKLFEMKRTPVDAKKLERWESFVSLIAETFSGEPYNLKYFQIWDEPHPTYGSYYDGTENFIENIHKPAANIIRQKGAEAVYGGWSNYAPVKELVDALDKTDSWQEIGVFNFYYQTVLGLNYFYNEAQKRGLENPYIWETKMNGGPSPSYAALFGPKLYHWTISRQAEDDQFKIFWNAWSNLPGPVPSLTQNGERTVHGAQIQAISGLLGGETIEPYENYTDTHGLRPTLTETDSSMEAFLIDGKRVVFAIHLLKQNVSGVFANAYGDSLHLGVSDSSVHLKLQGIKDVVSAKRIDMFGNAKPLEAKKTEKGFSVQTSVRDDAVLGENQNFPEAAAQINGYQYVVTFYIEVESSQPIENTGL